MAEAARVLTPLSVVESEVQEALDLCKGDPMMALRITLIANAFLEARIEELTTQVSTGFARGKIRKPAKKRN
jgi:hypothetical protein